MKNINNRLYRKIMHNISNAIYEEILRFDVTDYEDGESDIIDQLVVHHMSIEYKYFPRYTKQLKDLIKRRVEENPQEPYLLDIDTSKITDMYGLFGIRMKGKIERLDLSTWNTSNVTNMNYLFYGCVKLKEVDLYNWNTKNVTNMSSMFSGCKSLKELNLVNFNTSNVDDISFMFFDCRSLTSLDLSTWDVSSVFHMQLIFSGCKSLEKLNLGNWNIRKIDISNEYGIYNVFYGCTKLKKVLTNDLKILRLFNSSMRGLNETGYNFDITDYSDNEDDFIDRHTITNVIKEHPSNYEELCKLINDRYKNMENRYLDCSDIDVSNIGEDMTNLFDGFNDVETINITGWKTSNIENMSFMFYNCEKLKNIIGIGELDLSNVASIDSMFSGCESLETLDILNWDVSNVGNMYCLFNECRGLVSLDLSSWDVSSVYDMKYMFLNCYSLTNLYISEWNVSGVNDMSYMFCGCKSLKSLDISNWNVQNTMDMDCMFYGCKLLSDMDISNWEPPINLKGFYATFMFNNCNNYHNIPEWYKKYSEN